MAPLPSKPLNLLQFRTTLSSLTSLAHRTNTKLLHRDLLLPRQTIVAIPTTYGDLNNGPSPGTVVGIVLGSVAGFLFILWLLYTVFSFGNGRRTGDSVTTEIVRERRRSKGARTATTHRSRSRRRVSEIERERVEIRRPSPKRAPPPPAAPVPMERVVVEERRESISRPPPQVRRVSSDEVVVIEEHSPPPRRKSSRRDRERDRGAYRTVDPLAYGGGGAPMREISRHSSSRRSRG